MQRLEVYSKQYPIGSRIRCVEMVDDPYPVPRGTLGTVTGIDKGLYTGEYFIVVNWDTGSTLKLFIGVDRFDVVNE